MVEKIDFDKLVTAASEGSLSEDQIKAYFTLDVTKTKPFNPQFRINYNNVDVTGLEQTAAASGHSLAVEAGENASAAVRAAQIPADGTYVSEGDSWFRLPAIIYPRTMINFLAETYPINNLAHWGDTLAQMLDAKQYVPYLKARTVKYLLFSGGGNDLLGDTLEASLKIYDVGHNQPSDAAWYLTDVFYTQLDAVLKGYATLINQVRSLSPTTVLVVHGYDYAKPQENGIYLGIHFMRRGLHPRDHAELCLNIVKEMVDRFNSGLAALAAHDSSFRYVDLRNTVRDDEWYDSELHPRESAARRLAAKMAVALGPPEAAVAEAPAPAPSLVASA